MADVLNGFSRTQPQELKRNHGLPKQLSSTVEKKLENPDLDDWKIQKMIYEI
jgi:hypothetical protein